METTIWRDPGVCRVYQEGFNRISGQFKPLHDSQIHAYFYVWADPSCHVVKTDFDNTHIVKSKNEPVSPSGTVSNPAEADNKAGPLHNRLAVRTH